jgi:Phage DNA Adenine Methylase-like domain 1
MFIGAINENLRAVVAEIAHRWKGAKVYVGCTGNATVERIVSQFGPAELHGNDVSLYSCVLGSHLAGIKVEVKCSGRIGSG